VTFSSGSAGKTVGHASASILSGGLSLARETNGLAGNSGNATKVWADARISITPDATNEVGDSHTFTVLAEKNEGQGAGWVAADDGTIVAVTLTDSNGASSSVATDTCATGTVGGSCAVTFTQAVRAPRRSCFGNHPECRVEPGVRRMARGHSGDATGFGRRTDHISPDENGIGEDHTLASWQRRTRDRVLAGW
jgi:hypothetical protein